MILGGLYLNQPTAQDLNNIKTTGVYPVREAANRPIAYWGFLKVVNLGVDTTTYGVEQYFYTNGSSSNSPYREAIWHRKYIKAGSNENWTPWQRIDNYGTTSLEDLASALGVGSGASVIRFSKINVPANSSVVVPNVTSGCLIYYVVAGRGYETALYAYEKNFGLHEVYKHSGVFELTLDSEQQPILANPMNTNYELRCVTISCQG